MKNTRVVISLIIIFVCFGMFCGTSNTYAKPKSKEYHIKAAFLLNFIKFIQWPSHAFSDTPTSLTVNILGKDPFNEALDTIENKIVKNKRLVIKRISRIEDIKECQILFVCTPEKEIMSDILAKTKEKPILTVSETNNFFLFLGNVTFIIINSRLRFELNLEADERSGLLIS